MLKIVILLLIALCIACFSGCGGGGSSSGSDTTATVRIEPTRFFPNNVTIKAGDKVQWVNTDTQPHEVVSGTLLETGTPAAVRTFIISNTSLIPPAMTANFGDTIQFNNQSMANVTLSIRDSNNHQISSITILQGNIETFDFPSAGQFFFKQTNAEINGSIILFGAPNPTGEFRSVLLPSGGTFTVQFDTPGTFEYFDENQTNPNQSFMTGKVTVQ